MTEEKQETFPQQKLGLSTPEFVNFSLKAPMRQFRDIINDIEWNYRIGGNDTSEEAVVLIASITETTNSMYLVATPLIDAGYRVLIIDMPPYQHISTLMTGFDLLTASLLIAKIHFVGFGFGGFLALHLANFKQLSAEVESISIIAGFMDVQTFKKPMSFFTKLTAKAALFDELDRATVPEHLKESVNFVASEIDVMPIPDVINKLKVRSTAPPAQKPNIDSEKILVIQPLDWTYKVDNSVRPHKAIEGVVLHKIEKGGNFAELANPEEVVNQVKEHLSRWHLPPENQDDEVEEEDF